jgi:hypothetical protein
MRTAPSQEWDAITLLKTISLAVGSIGIDCLSPVSAVQASQIASYVIPGTASRPCFVVRYLENLTAGELAGLLAASLRVVLVGESRPNGWVPSAGLGGADAVRLVSKLRELMIPSGVSVFCDLEGLGGVTQDAIEYCNAWSNVMSLDGYTPAAYVGEGVDLSSLQLYQLPFRGYWHSLSNVQPVAGCDYQMLQLYPTAMLYLPRGPFQADLNVVYEDKRGRTPIAVIES